MKSVLSFLSVVLILLFSSCNNNAEKTEGTDNDKKDTLNLDAEKKSDAALEAEWVLELINNEKTPVSMNLIFSPNGEFSQVTASGTVKGTYKKSEDGKKIILKSEAGEDNWIY
jgi:hypothetical protein